MSTKVTYPSQSGLAGDTRLASGSVEFLAPGTMNFKPIYTEPAMTRSLCEQIGLDSRGLPTIDLWREDNSAYRVIFRSREGSILFDGALDDYQAKLDPAAESRIPLVAQRGKVWAVIGTSLTQQNHSANSAFKISTLSKGWWSWVQTMLNGQILSPQWYDPTVRAGWEPNGAGSNSTVYMRGANAGIGGALLADMDVRITYLIENIKVDGVIYEGGTNDIASKTKEYIFAKRCEHIDRLLRAGIAVVVTSILPRSLADWPAGGDRRRKANWVNRMTANWCRKRRNCYFYEWGQYWIDFYSADGVPKAGYSDDGTHMTTISAHALAKPLAVFMQAILPPLSSQVAMSPDDKYHATYNPLGNKMANPLLTGTGGIISAPVTGVAANSMRVLRNSGASACVASKDATAGERGNAQVMTFTGVAAAGTSTFYFQTSVTDVAHGFPVGSWVMASVEVECSAWAGWKGATMLLREKDSVATEGIISYGMEDYGDAWPNEAWKYTICSVPLQIKYVNGTLQWCLRIMTDDNSAGSGVIKARMVSLQEVEDPRIVLDYHE